MWEYSFMPFSNLRQEHDGGCSDHDDDGGDDMKCK